MSPRQININTQDLNMRFDTSQGSLGLPPHASKTVTFDVYPYLKKHLIFFPSKTAPNPNVTRPSNLYSNYGVTLS